MAMTPSSLLAKLDELKKWQQTQQERLMRQHHQRLEETDRGSSDYDSIPGLSAYNSYNTLNDSNLYKSNAHANKKRENECETSSEKLHKSDTNYITKEGNENEPSDNVYENVRTDQVNKSDNIQDNQSYDKHMSSNGYGYVNQKSISSKKKDTKPPLDKNKNISPVENKTSAINLTNMPLFNKPSPPDVFETNAKPKRPFLKRGSGLGKFGMKPGDQNRPFNKMRPPETAVHKRLAALRREEAPYKGNNQDDKEQEENKNEQDKINKRIQNNSDKEVRVSSNRIQKNGDKAVSVSNGLQKNTSSSDNNKDKGERERISNQKNNKDNGFSEVIYDEEKVFKKSKSRKSNEAKIVENNDDKRVASNFREHNEVLKMNEDQHFSEKCLPTRCEATVDVNGINNLPNVFSRNEDFIASENYSEIENHGGENNLYTNQIESLGKPKERLNFDKFLNALKQSEINENKDITPLKVPQIYVQSRAKWFSVDNNNELTEIPENNNKLMEVPDNCIKLNEIHDSNNLLMDIHENNSLMECLKKLAEERFGKNADETSEIIKDFESLHLDETPDLQKKLADCLEQLLAGENDSYTEKNKKLVIECLEELVGNCSDADSTSIRELHAFEQLERKVMSSSFCSTNSSVLDLLSSTPFKKLVNEPKSVHFENSNPRRDSAKRELVFEGHHSDESTVTSEDFNERTLPQNHDFEDTGTSASTSTSTFQERKVIVKQNACVMTDDLDFTLAEDGVLKKRLKELDLEIGKFRVENAKLQKLKGEVESEKRDLQKSRKKLEKEIQDERINMEFELEEEKKKLAKEKMVFEKYVKDLQNKPSKKEREEISALKAELANVKETLKLKETRNGTTQARLRTQLKSMEKEIVTLKEEIEKLQKQNAKLTAAQKVIRKTPSDTKMLHEINKNLTKLTKDAKTGKQEKDDSFEEKKRRKKKKDRFETEYQRSFGRGSDDDGSNSDKREKSWGRRSTELSGKSKSPDEVPRRKLTEGKLVESPEFYNSKRCVSRQRSLESYRSKSESCKNNLSDSAASESDEVSSRYSLKSYKRRASRDGNKSTNSLKNLDLTCGALDKENDRNSTNCGDMTTFRNLSDLSIENNYDKVFGQQGEKLRNNSLNDTEGSISGKTVSILEDGSKETKYSNGNVKIVSPDGNFITMKYFNGDIKETKLLDGSIKYFYAQDEIWHATLPNGDEILEYSDGRVEKHFTNGTIEVSYPNGIVKTTLQDGKENITYPDGSIVSVNGNEKVLVLPNGQKEIHTKEHKRREYPDGTVKILYPDGLQETRYSNGRIRMKDKDGHLLMDTHDDI